MHLNYCNNSFIPPLNTRVDLKEYSKKIYNNAVTFEAWHDQRLIGLIATYFNKEDNFGFITSVSLAKEYSGVGIASKLLEMCVEYAAKHHYDELKLEVNNDNIPAVNFYKKYNFTQIDINKDSLMMKYILKNK
ncbi:MAG: GNAT family N-acetyltransferase [Burkholderiales bacterium]|nr:GNAT family N-acetyltransferase [Bacteroidia bacterium]